VCIGATEACTRPAPQGRAHKCPVLGCKETGQQRVQRDTVLQAVVDKLVAAATAEDG